MPLVVNINIKVIPCSDHQAIGDKLFAVDIDGDVGLLALRILRAARQVMPRDEFVDLGLLGLRVGVVEGPRRVDRGVRVVVVLALSWVSKTTVKQSLCIAAPPRMTRLRL